MISSLSGKALRTLLESRGLQSDPTCVLEAKLGKHDIKRRKPGILFISLPIGSLFKLAIMTLLSILCGFSVIGDVIQKVQRHHDLIKTHAVRKPMFIRSTCKNAVNIRDN